jgi:hypothetical protein
MKICQKTRHEIPCAYKESPIYPEHDGREGLFGRLATASVRTGGATW